MRLPNSAPPVEREPNRAVSPERDGIDPSAYCCGTTTQCDDSAWYQSACSDRNLLDCNNCT
jgi:hypothetical protein